MHRGAQSWLANGGNLPLSGIVDLYLHVEMMSFLAKSLSWFHAFPKEIIKLTVFVYNEDWADGCRRGVRLIAVGLK